MRRLTKRLKRCGREHFAAAARRRPPTAARARPPGSCIKMNAMGISPIRARGAAATAAGVALALVLFAVSTAGGAQQASAPLPTAPVSEPTKTVTVQKPDHPPTLILTTDESIDDLSRQMEAEEPGSSLPYQADANAVRALTDDEATGSSAAVAAQTDAMASTENGGMAGAADGMPGGAMEDASADGMRRWLSMNWPWAAVLLGVLLLVAAAVYYRAKTRQKRSSGAESG